MSVSSGRSAQTWQGSPAPSLGGPTDDAVAASLPKAYLNAYPLPAFIVRLGGEQARKPAAQLSGPHVDTRGRVTASAGSGNIRAPQPVLAKNSLSIASAPTPLSAAALRKQFGGNESPNSGSEVLSSPGADGSTTTTPGSTPLSTPLCRSTPRNRVTPLSSGARSGVDSAGDSSTASAMSTDDYWTPSETDQDVPSISVSDYARGPGLVCVWGNDKWTQLSQGLSLDDLLDKDIYMAFESWLHDRGNETAAVLEQQGHNPAIFSLRVSRAVLSVIKTRHEPSPPGTAMWVITGVSITDVKRPAYPTEVSFVANPPGGEKRPIMHERTQASEELCPQLPNLPLTTHADGHVPSTWACTDLINEIDWSRTSIGPREQWRPEIATMVNLSLLSSAQKAVWIGPELIGVYNQAYSQLVDHPNAFGRSLKEVWSELWDDLMGTLVERALKGEPVTFESGLMLFQRGENGHWLEQYLSFTLYPIRGPDREILGIWNSSIDHTSTILAERRLGTARVLVEEVAFAQSSHEFYQTVASVLSRNTEDVPFAMLYSVKNVASGGDWTSTSHSAFSDIELHLEATVGVPPGHPSAPESMRLDEFQNRSVTSSLTDDFTSDGFASGWGSSKAKSSAASGDAWGSSKAKSSAASADARSHGTRSNPNTNTTASGSIGSIQSADSNATTRSPLSSAGSGSVQSSNSTSLRRTVLSSNVGSGNTVWPLRRALEARECFTVDIKDQIKGFPIRQWDDLPEQAVVIPINNESDASLPHGVLIMGLNLYRPFDAEYREWAQMLRVYMSSALGAVTSYEEEMRHRLDKEKMEKAKTAWFQGAAHEFGTPLTLIAGPIEELLHSNLTKQQRKQLVVASNNVDRLKQLTNSLLEFTRLESGKVTARFVATDLGELIRQLSDVFRVAIERLGINFVVDVEEHPPINVDPVLLEVVISHLIVNALKFTEHGSVTIRLRYTNGQARVTVTDTGLGIAIEDLETVTDWFHRTKSVKNRGPEATGIGLSLVKEILRLHDGRLSIKSATLRESKSVTGSAFTASVPINLEANAAPPAAVAAVGVYAKAVAQDITDWLKDDRSEPSTDEAMSGPSSESHLSTGGFQEALMFEPSDVLLVVDNSTQIREYIKMLFEPFCTVVEAASAEEAIVVAKETKPSLVISEFMMRGMSGVDLLRELRQGEETRFTPVVLLWPSADDEQRVGALVLGADDFLGKPFKPRELLLRVNFHMQMGKKRTTLENLFTQRELEISILSDYCSSGILRTDADGRLMYANQAFRIPAGMTEGDDPARWVGFCETKSQPRIQRAWDDILNGTESTTTLQWKWRTGRTMSAVFVRLDIVNPNLSGVLACVTDISYQEERIEEEQRRRREAEESKHQQELLVDLTSHEIRTPVSAILQCSSLVKENIEALREQLRTAGDTGFKPTRKLLADLDDDVEALESIYQCGLVQERIAGDVLSLGRIQLDVLSLYFVEMDLRQEANKVLSVFASEARMKKIEIKRVFGDSMATLGISSLKTDPVRLGQVVTNLVANAIRFTASSSTRRITVHYDVAWQPPQVGSFVPPPGSQTRPASLPPEDTPLYLFVSVTDTGPGMTPSEQTVLFQRFQQGNRMIHTRYGGSGLGLYICKKITELLGGAIEVQSQVGVGSVFRFWVKTYTTGKASSTPLQSPSPAASPLPKRGLTIAGDDEPAVNGTADDDELEAAKGDALHLLIVEDNIINQTVLKRQMVKAGFECDVANNGQEALNKIRAADGAGAPYDVVLMDLEMPVMDGLTAVRAIRVDEKAGAVSSQLVIALTGNARQGQIDQALAAGMNAVVIKPYRLLALIEKIHAAVGARREMRAATTSAMDERRAAVAANPTASPTLSASSSSRSRRSSSRMSSAASSPRAFQKQPLPKDKSMAKAHAAAALLTAHMPSLDSIDDDALPLPPVPSSLAPAFDVAPTPKVSTDALAPRNSDAPTHSDDALAPRNSDVPMPSIDSAAPHNGDAVPAPAHESRVGSLTPRNSDAGAISEGAYSAKALPDGFHLGDLSDALPDRSSFSSSRSGDDGDDGSTTPHALGSF